MPPTDRLLLAALALASAAVAAPAEAACTVSASGVAFGVYDPGTNTPDDGVGQVVVDCHPSDQPPTVALGAGAGDFSAREMNGGSDSLEYNLYTSVARNIVWGDGTNGSATVTLSGGTVNRGRRIFTRAIYGRIRARQSVSAGAYSDLIMVTVIF